MDAETVVVDLGLYSRDAIRKVAYKFSGDWYVELASVSDQTINVHFTPKGQGKDRDLVRKEFFNELLDQTLRERIASETLAVRNLIMAHALSKLDLNETPDGPSSTRS